MRKIVIIAVLTIAALFGGVVAAGTASANAQGETIGRLKHATTSYQEPTKQSVPVHFNLKQGQQVLVVCFLEGSEYKGSHVWYRIGQDGLLCFVPRDDVIDVNPSHLRHC